jgi:hypothetical protein
VRAREAILIRHEKSAAGKSLAALSRAFARSVSLN